MRDAEELTAKADSKARDREVEELKAQLRAPERRAEDLGEGARGGQRCRAGVEVHGASRAAWSRRAQDSSGVYAPIRACSGARGEPR